MEAKLCSHPWEVMWSVLTPESVLVINMSIKFFLRCRLGYQYLRGNNHQSCIRISYQIINW
jgi:hypothetical protein